MLFELEIHTGDLAMHPVRGRRTFFAKLRLGKRRAWLMRWDTERTPRPFAYSRDRLMCWSAGID